MKKESRKECLNKDEVNEMIESAIRRHNRRSTIISSVLGWILIGGYSFGLFQAVQNVQLKYNRSHYMLNLVKRNKYYERIYQYKYKSYKKLFK